MNRFKELNKRVVQWANDKGILEKGTPLKQLDKTFEEVLETKESLLAQANNLEFFNNSKGEYVDTNEQIIDDFGDQLVTMLIGCKMQNLNPLDCLETALNIIENRDGKMINGQFVKDK